MLPSMEVLVLVQDPPDIRQYDHIREERWTHFSLEGVKFPTATVDAIQRSEALDPLIHFQQISKAAALYVSALLGGVKRTLEVYRRVDHTTDSYSWCLATTEHAQGVLMVALTNLNLHSGA